MQKKMMAIELGIADDIKKVVTESNAMLTELNARYAALEKADAGFNIANAAAQKASQDANKSYSTASKLQTKIGTILEKADKAAKELGVAPTSVVGYNEADKLYDELETNMKKVNSFSFPIAEKVSKLL